MHERPEQCHNCDTPLQGDFCHVCGQEAVLESPTFREFLHEYLHHYVALEGKLWRTLRTLLLSPGKLTMEFMRGRRQRYVKPLALYITFSFLFFLLLNLGGPSQSISAPSPAAEGKASVQIAPPHAAGALPDEPVQLVLPDGRQAELSSGTLLGVFKQAFGKLSYLIFALLPLYTFWLWLFYRKRALPPGTHLVFAFHYHAFFFLALLPGQLAAHWFPALAWGEQWTLLVWWLYLGFALHHVYAGRFWPQLLRAGVLMVLHGCTVVLAFAGLMLLFGMQVVDQAASTAPRPTPTQQP